MGEGGGGGLPGHSEAFAEDPAPPAVPVVAVEVVTVAITAERLARQVQEFDWNRGERREEELHMY